MLKEMRKVAKNDDSLDSAIEKMDHILNKSNEQLVTAESQLKVKQFQDSVNCKKNVRSFLPSFDKLFILTLFQKSC